MEHARLQSGDGGRKRRIVFINRYFFPDHSATSQIVGDLAFALARNGENISVITSAQLYETANAGLARHSVVEGVDIHRRTGTRFGRKSMPGRVLDYFSFHVAGAAALWRLTKAGDIVVCLTDPPLLSVPVGMVCRLRKLVLVNWLQDLYPEVAVEARVPAVGGGFGRFLRWLRNRSVRKAAMNVAIGRAMAARLEVEQVSREKIATIENWSFDADIRPTPAAENRLRGIWQLEGKFVVGHSGNIGIAHDIDTLLDAAEQLRDRTDICFLMIGGGFRVEKLKEETTARGLANFVFQPYQPRDALPETLTLPDVHWLSLKPEFEGLIVPSKFYGIAAAGRPMLFIGSPTGELGSLICAEKCGYVCAPRDGKALASQILALADDARLRIELGANARQLIDTRYAMHLGIARWRELLGNIAPERES